MLPTLTTSAASAHITYPPASLFRFPPSSLPLTLTPPVSDYTLARPFNIDPKLYNDLLDVNYPITIALVYATTVIILNKVNQRRGHKPWPISKTAVFFAFVVAHNVFLATYSAWTFIGMVNAIKVSMPSWRGGDGLVEVVDALCKIHGPRGIGNATSFNSSTRVWSAKKEAIKLLGGIPDSTDVGRIWNEGLAFYGWIFYLSKFYEVLDTVIILAKGKSSSLLQTYHHAGAMICMWAGIRYMSPPIWMFVLVNSGIHTLMYAYYTLAVFGIRTPLAVKRALTTLQIAQFGVGFSYAVLHLFVAYSFPVSVPYIFTYRISTAIPDLASSATSAIASATASAGLGSWLKKIALRAAGEEGLAENVRNNLGQTFGIDSVHKQQVEKAMEETRYRLESTTVDCIDTDGQAFALLLNAIYLLPLTVLFVNFFIRSYLRRTGSSTSHPTQNHSVKKSSHDAAKGLEREIREAMEAGQDQTDPAMRADAKANFKDMKDKVKQGLDKGMEEASWFGRKSKKAASNAGDKAKATADDLSTRAKCASEDVKGTVNDLANGASDKVEASGKDLKEDVKATTKEINEKSSQAAEDAVPTAKAAADKATEKVKAAADDVKVKGDDQVSENPKIKAEEGHGQENGVPTTGKDAMAYEASIDEITSKKEKQAEKET